MMICPNCGAEIEEQVTKCPYCGFINIEGAEQKYNEEIEEIKDNIALVQEEPAKALKKGLSNGVKVVIKTIIALVIVAAAIAGILAYELKDHPKEFFKTAEDEAYEAAYRMVAAEELEAAYENKDIAQMASIYDEAYSVDRVSLWGDPHYETAYAASLYMKLQLCLTNLDKEKLKNKEAEEITYYCFYFYYRAYGDDGAELFDELREYEIIPIITERLGFSIEDMENFRYEVTASSGVNRSYVHKATKKYYKNYH